MSDSYLRHSIDYDANGNRLSDTYWDKVIYADGGTAAGFTTERYTYDAINRLTTLRRDGLLLDARYYDGADRVVLSGIDGSLGKAFFDRSGLAGEQRRNVYDGAGRLYSARVVNASCWGRPGQRRARTISRQRSGRSTGATRRPARVRIGSRRATRCRASRSRRMAIADCGTWWPRPMAWPATGICGLGRRSRSRTGCRATTTTTRRSSRMTRAS
ncbi:hypothetical protein [Achromobacter pulmonis]|uniref:hypothetical protein n=1 Tax=Achromobacter pulmonis TaxID=1389932 RepID=UPI001F401629|nr:hypothetical protein [Achromobacter pulmonis]